MNETRVKAIAARKEMHTILRNQVNTLPEKSLSGIGEVCGSKNRISDMARGNSYIPASMLESVFEYCEIESCSEVWNSIMDLEKDCILGKDRDKELSLLESIRKKHEESFKMSSIEELRKDFGALLTQYLFKNGFNLRITAGRIGCSEHELLRVIDGEVCLAPHYVDRFHETLEMPYETVKKFSELSRKCYERPSVSERIIEYITSDGYILEVLDKAAKKDLPVSKWKEFETIVKEDRSRRFQELKSHH